MENSDALDGIFAATVRNRFWMGVKVGRYERLCCQIEVVSEWQIMASCRASHRLPFFTVLIPSPTFVHWVLNSNEITYVAYGSYCV